VTVLLETERLRLRAFTPDDAGRLYELNADRDVMWFLTGGEPTPREEVRDRVVPYFLGFYERHGRGGLGYWAAETRDAREFLGWFHLRPDEAGGVDVGYRLRKAAWNQGYATEGARALVGWSFTRLGATRVTGHTMTVNQASRRVLEKSGLALIRTYHDDAQPAIPGAELGAVEYALTREEWLAAGGSRQN
jgi:RimJ/RimL family protein N-acetyltransferase